jgi:hypothetical protein
MRTHFVGSVQLDPTRLAKDLDQCRSFQWSEAYSDYVFGGSWKSCMLWARGGEAGDGVVTNYAYDKSSSFTEYGEQLPYVHELITDHADLARLNFARLALVSDSVIIPHRDLLELSELPDDARNAHRMHIPLATNEDCFFSEDNVVYRMREGEVWFLDASRIHSVAVLSNEPRFHLMLDFVNVPGDGPLAKVDGAASEADGIPAHRVVARPPLTESERADLLKLAGVLTMDTFDEIFSIVIKKHFRRDGGDGFVWDTMTEIARATGETDVLSHTLELQTHYTLERSASDPAP